MSEDEKKVRVIDSSVTAEHPLRVHDVMVNGEVRQVAFKLGEETFLPLEVGVKFMQDGFTVFEPGSMDQVMLPPSTDETVRVKIGEGKVVAKYEELTVSALTIRAASRPGGEIFLKNGASAKEIIDFLIQDEARKGGVPGEVELEIDEMEEVPASIVGKIGNIAKNILGDDSKEIESIAPEEIVVPKDKPVAGDPDFIGPVQPTVKEEPKKVVELKKPKEPEEPASLPPLPTKEFKEE